MKPGIFSSWEEWLFAGAIAGLFWFFVWVGFQLVRFLEGV